MLKRDVEMIARVIKANAGNRPKLAEAFANELCQIVSAFDRIKFYRQCGVKVPRTNEHTEAFLALAKTIMRK